MADVLGVLLETIRQVAILVQPVMPESVEKLLEQLAVSKDERNFDRICDIPSCRGRKINKPTGVFPRFVEDEAT